ncbi:MAG: hypothetical protein MJ000_11045 [Bacteroidales bacterium]|nr:hypothetical protein [Bacteroidales bacterium]
MKVGDSVGFFKSNKGTVISEMFKITEDFAMFKSGQMVNVNLFDTELKLHSPGTKNDATLEYSKITDVFYGPQSSIVEKDKSIIGRAVVGGLLFGGAGAIVGAMTANGKKEKQLNRIMFVISYTGSNGMNKFIALEDTRLYKGKKLSEKLKELCNITDQEPEQAHDIIL